MVHNGIEYGLMAAYAEGLNILKHANVGKNEPGRSTPRRRRCASRSYYQYDIDIADVAEVWRRGSVVASWLLDLTADALAKNSDARRLLRPGHRTPARAAGRCSPPSTRASPPTC